MISAAGTKRTGAMSELSLLWMAPALQGLLTQ